jgi:hypothetical protein
VGLGRLHINTKPDIYSLHDDTVGNGRMFVESTCHAIHLINRSSEQTGLLKAKVCVLNSARLTFSLSHATRGF